MTTTHKKPKDLTEVQSCIWDNLVKRGLDPTVRVTGQIVATLAQDAGCSRKYVQMAQEAICTKLDVTLQEPTFGDEPAPAAAPHQNGKATVPEPEPAAAPEPETTPEPVTETESVRSRYRCVPIPLSSLLGLGAPREDLAPAYRKRALQIASQCPDDLEVGEWAEVLQAAARAARAVA